MTHWCLGEQEHLQYCEGYVRIGWDGMGSDIDTVQLTFAPTPNSILLNLLLTGFVLISLSICLLQVARATALSEAAGLGDKCKFQVCSLCLVLSCLALACLAMPCLVRVVPCRVLSLSVLATIAVIIFVARIFPLFVVVGQVADALNTPFEAESFDLVWSMESGEHMPHKPKYVALPYQLLAPTT